MNNSDECSAVNALNVESNLMGASGSRFENNGWRSERVHKRRRWSPYSKKRKLHPKKAFSLETIPIRPKIERAQSFELTQSTEDCLSIQSEPSIDLNDCIVAETTQTTEFLTSTIDGEFSTCLENDYVATENQPFAQCLECSAESGVTLEEREICISVKGPIQPTESHFQSTTEQNATKTGQPLAEWLLWCAYAKLMKLAWRNSRENLNEQTHRAENCELQAKSTMTQVYSMKTQLKADIRQMKEGVKKIQSIRGILDSTEEDKNRLQSANETLKAKIECLNEERNRLSEEISNTDGAIEEYCSKAELLKTQLKACDDELAELKAEKVVLDSEIQKLMSLSEQTKENIITGRKNLYNRESEISDIERELAASKEKISIESRMLKTVRKEAQFISEEIQVATEGGEELQKQLVETREKVMSRDSLIAELSAKVASAVEQISGLKRGVETAEKKSLWRRFKFLPKDSHSLFSIQL